MPKKNKNIPADYLKKETADVSIRANRKEAKIMGLVSKEIKNNTSIHQLNPYVALKYYKSEWQCFSDWKAIELKEFSAFIKSLQSHTWQQVYQTGGKIPKHGLAYTKYDIKDVRSHSIQAKLESVKELISEEISFFELRVNQNKLRVHGFQSQSIFFLVALDRNHEAFPD